MSWKENPRYRSTPCSRYCENTWSSGESAAALPMAVASSPLLVMKKEKRPCMQLQEDCLAISHPCWVGLTLSSALVSALLLLKYAQNQHVLLSHM